MADRKLTPEEKVQKEQEKQLKLKEKQEKEAEKAQKESNINILKMIYENVRTSKHEDLYIVFDGEKHGVFENDREHIVIKEHSYIILQARKRRAVNHIEVGKTQYNR